MPRYKYFEVKEPSMKGTKKGSLRRMAAMCSIMGGIALISLSILSFSHVFPKGSFLSALIADMYLIPLITFIIGVFILAFCVAILIQDRKREQKG